MSTIENTNAAINVEATIGDLCAFVADGGTMLGFCEANDLRYKLINRWIADDETRAERYALALTIREAHAKDLIISELIAYMKADVTSCFDEAGNLKTLPSMGANERKLIAGVEFKELFEMQGARGEKQQVHVGNLIKIRFWDKPRSIETFMKHLAMLVDRKQVDVGETLADLIAGKKQPERV